MRWLLLVFLVVIPASGRGAFTLRLTGPTGNVVEVPSMAPVNYDGTVCTQSSLIQVNGTWSTLDIEGAPCNPALQGLIIDGLAYPYPSIGGVDLNAYEAFFNFNGPGPANCHSLSGANIGAGSFLASFTDGLLLGLAPVDSFNLVIDNGVWYFQLNTLSGDVVCDGGVPFVGSDVIFSHGFE